MTDKQTEETHPQPDQFGFRDFALLEGETIEAAIDLAGGGRNGPVARPDAMLLTPQRVIHIEGNGRRRRAVFASLQDIDAVELGYHREGNGAFIWAALALVVAILLYFVIDSNSGSIAAAVIVTLMGVYLVVDQVLSPGKSQVVFRAGTSEVRCQLKANPSSDDIQHFINQVFQLKADNSRDYARGDHFSPR
jgi:hypothetical protein